jgi:sulfonate transport system substrate-binding protein
MSHPSSSDRVPFHSIAAVALVSLILASVGAGPAHAGDPAGQAAVLRMGDQKGGSEALMKAAGVLEDLPYKIEWRQFPAAAPLLEALNAGAVDGAFAGDAPTTFALAAGVRARVIAANRADGGSTAILVAANSPIRDFADLKGKRIATGRGSIGHYLVLAAGRRLGWGANDVTFAFLPPADGKAALDSGSVDAWSSWSIYVAQATLADGSRIVVDGKGLLSGLTFQVASEAAIAGKRAALADYVGRLARARRWAASHIEEYAKAWAAETGVSEAVAAQAYRMEPMTPVAIDAGVVADEQRTADLYADAGIIPGRFAVAQSFDPSFNDSIGR